jgi:hypothetical protein
MRGYVVSKQLRPFATLILSPPSLISLADEAEREVYAYKHWTVGILANNTPTRSYLSHDVTQWPEMSRK